jgi:hypothetical protein
MWNLSCCSFDLKIVLENYGKLLWSISLIYFTVLKNLKFFFTEEHRFQLESLSLRYFTALLRIKTIKLKLLQFDYYTIENGSRITPFMVWWPHKYGITSLQPLIYSTAATLKTKKKQNICAEWLRWIIYL